MTCNGQNYVPNHCCRSWILPASPELTTMPAFIMSGTYFLFAPPVAAAADFMMSTFILGFTIMIAKCVIDYLSQCCCWWSSSAKSSIFHRCCWCQRCQKTFFPLRIVKSTKKLNKRHIRVYLTCDQHFFSSFVVIACQQITDGPPSETISRVARSRLYVYGKKVDLSLFAVPRRRGRGRATMW